MHRFFIDKENIKDSMAIITGEDVNHITNVLRLKENKKIILCDSEGTDYLVVIKSIAKHQVIGEIIKKEMSIGEIDIDITLYQSIPKLTKMDLIIQKCTELGVSKIVPVLSSRTIVKLVSKKDELKKVERWRKIAKESAKQSCRGKVPNIHIPITYEKALEDSLSKDLVLIPYEKERNGNIKKILKTSMVNSIGIFIGPEGGFEANEIESAVKRKGIPVTLGNRILRTETAAFMLISCILYEYNQI